MKKPKIVFNDDHVSHLLHGKQYFKEGFSSSPQMRFHWPELRGDVFKLLAQRLREGHVYPLMPFMWWAIESPEVRNPLETELDQLRRMTKNGLLRMDDLPDAVLTVITAPTVPALEIDNGEA